MEAEKLKQVADNGRSKVNELENQVGICLWCFILQVTVANLIFN